MGWDKSSRPRRLRRKHKLVIILVALVGSISIVVVTGLWNSFTQEDHTDVMIKLADSIFDNEEKRIIWDGMSDEGKEVILKRAPNTESK